MCVQRSSPKPWRERRKNQCQTHGGRPRGVKMFFLSHTYRTTVQMCAPPTPKKERQASFFSYFIDRVHIKKDCFSRSLIQSLSLSLTHSDRACFLRTTVPYSHWLLSFSFPTFQDTTSSPSTLSLSLSLCAVLSNHRRAAAKPSFYINFPWYLFSLLASYSFFLPSLAFYTRSRMAFKSVASPHRQYTSYVTLSSSSQAH